MDMRASPPTQPLPAKQTIHPNISVKIDCLSLVPSQVARNFSVVIVDQLTHSEHVASVAWSGCYALFNIRKIRLFLTQKATQLLLQTMVIARLD